MLNRGELKHTFSFDSSKMPLRTWQVCFCRHKSFIFMLLTDAEKEEKKTTRLPGRALSVSPQLFSN